MVQVLDVKEDLVDDVGALPLASVLAPASGV